MLAGKDWQGVLQSINAPVILFGLGLLVVSTATVLIVSQGELDSSERLWVASERLWVVIGGASLILTVFVMVFALCWFRPKNLMFTAAAHLEQYRLTNQVELVASERISIEPTISPVDDDVEAEQESG